jgi:hypothetical protein
MTARIAFVLLLVPLASGCLGLRARRADDLHVTKAVLYQNGIGYFERQGRVEGDMIKLRILPQQIADVLKSLTVVDLGDGRAVNVALPVEKTRARRLAALPQQVRDGGGLMAIAQAFRGAEAAVSSRDGSGTGRIVGVEQLAEEGEWRLTILKDSGTLQSFDLKGVSSLQIKDRTLEVGLRKALDVALDEGSWKPVELVVHLAGRSPHDLLVSYVVDMPTWKPAYRVVLTKEKKEALLQGWAVVDNVSGEDWDGVTLSLTAGTPLTFTYDLYTPRFVRRPDLSPQQEAMAEAPPPPTSGASAVDELDAPKAEPAPEAESSRDKDGEGYASGKGDYRAKKKEARKMASRRSRGGPGGGAPAAKAAEEQPMAPPPPSPPSMSSELLEKGFRALVSGSRVGSLFRYDIDEPVTIKDRQSALVSILNKHVPAEDILLYRIDSSSTNPYRAVRLTNTTGYIIEKGPVAIYRDGNFVGEAVGGQVEAGTSTFVPYSVDGRFVVSLEDRVDDESASLVKIVNGYIVTEVKRVTVHKYTVYNQAGDKATMYIQRAHRSGWKLTKPSKGVLVEKDYFFAPMEVAAKGKTEFEVREETPVRNWLGLDSRMGQQAVALYLKDPSADPKVSGQLREALALQDQIAKLDDDIEKAKRDKQNYTDRQTQVRENLKLLGKSIRNADLAKKLTATLLELETKLNDVTRTLVALDTKRQEVKDRLTVLIKSISLTVKP